MDENNVLVIISGGTIDAKPYKGPIPVNIEPLEESIVPRVLEELGLADQTTCFSWLRKDSKDFSRGEIENLAELIRAHESRSFVITHGTDRIPENARLLKRLLKDSGKRVIFTGAMVPIMNEVEGYEKSDGYDNLKFAVEQAQAKGEGVFIAFAGKLMDPDFVRKDFTEKKFVEQVQKVVDGPAYSGRSR